MKRFMAKKTSKSDMLKRKEHLDFLTLLRLHQDTSIATETPFF